MTERIGRALRAARTERGWSQAEAGAKLRALALRRRGPAASAASSSSLKTQLSRWENGHATPEAEYRELLTELYDRTATELGLMPAVPEESGGADRLRAALAAASALDDGSFRLWEEQLALVQRLDDELGAAGSGGLVGALVAHVAHALDHAVAARRRIDLARILGPAAVLAGTQALDQCDPDAAWRHHCTARSAALESASPADLAVAIAGQCDVLGDIGMTDAALDLLAGEPAPPAVRCRLAAARAATHAVAGNAPDAHRALDEAERALPVVDAVHRPDGPAIELSDLHRWRGHTLTTLHDPAAIQPLESALAARPRSARHRAWLHADLAHTLSAAGRPEDAAEHACAARGLATRIGSVRVIARLGSSLDRSHSERSHDRVE